MGSRGEVPQEGETTALPQRMTVEELLSDPHYGSLYRDEAYLLAYTSGTPFGEFAGDFGDTEETVKGALNRMALAQMKGVSPEEVDLTYEVSMPQFGLGAFGREAKSEKEFYSLMSARAGEMDAEQGLSGGDGGESDEEDSETWFRRKYPVISVIRDLVRGGSGAVLDIYGARPEKDPAITLKEQRQRGREALARLGQLNSGSFNFAQVLAYDDGQGHLVPNWEGLGALGAGFATEWLNGVLGRRMMKPPGGEAIRFDPDTKGYYRGNVRLTEEEAQEIKARRSLVVGGKGQSVATEGEAGSISTWAEERSKSAPNEIIYAGDSDKYFYNGREITAEEAARVSRERPMENFGLNRRFNGREDVISKYRGVVQDQNGKNIFISSDKLVIREQSGNVFDLLVRTSKGDVSILCEINRLGDDLIMNKLHIQGTGAGQLALTGLFEIKGILMESTRQIGIKRVIIIGEKRGSGRMKGKMPSRIVFSVN